MAEWSNAAGCKPADESLRRFESYFSQVLSNVSLDVSYIMGP